MKPKIDICVASYKRPRQLETLLRSLVAQETEGEFTFTIVVADNDAARSAEPTVRAFAAEGLDVVYGVEPEQSVSLARNRSLSFASGDLIAITDDDLHADGRWLLHLVRALTAHGADVVHGPVVPEFRPGTPAYIRDCPLFNRPSPPSGSSTGFIFTTANALFRRSLIDGMATPFDPRFGRTGGEDSAFFNGLAARGARMIWCREARVYGPVPDERANLGWILRRRFRYGNLHPITAVHAIDRRDVRSTSARAVKQSLAAAWHLIAGIFSRDHHDEGMKALLAVLLDVAFLCGIVAHYGNFHYEEYRPR